MTAWEPERVDEYRALTEYSTDIVSVLDESGTIRYQSPSAERILGEDPSTRIGTNAFEYVHPEDREHITEKFVEMVQSPGTVTERVEYRFKHGDGSWMWIESIGSNRTDTAIDGYVVNSRDVTERKEKEQRLERQNERLEEFASVVSHDIRNPLTIAQGRLELLREEYDSEHIDPVDRALTRIDTLIEDLLTLAHRGDWVSGTDPVDLSDLAVECWRTVETANATIQTRIDRTIRADRSRLAQLLENLIRNAIEHGGGEVTVTIGELDDGFYVEDDGPGIPEDERTDVFVAGHSAGEGGIGLGLSIVKQVANAHGWDIGVTVGSAEGARFEITDVEFVD
jgi:PAS domain S-box-containing protein